jgi:hypothetical protein
VDIAPRADFAGSLATVSPLWPLQAKVASSAKGLEKREARPQELPTGVAGQVQTM